MSRHASTGSVKNRPPTISTKSFARYEPTQSSNRARASTVQSISSQKSPSKPETIESSVFEKPTEDESDTESPVISRSMTLPDRFDELPIELASLTDRFVDSLSAKVFNEPPTIDQLSDIFQEFYNRASASIQIHISALKTRLSREVSPGPRPTLRSRTLSSKPSNDSLAPPDASVGSQQMLTASEVAEKRKARRLLELKKILLEEAVERRACEKIYDKIWRHKSTLDDERDEKLRSKTAALALVGIGLRDLGIELDPDSKYTLEDVQESLAPAREGLAKMNDERYPLGKLQHLTTAHKAIVDTLSTIHKSSSSADEILPTLIYTLITSPIEGINIISNLYFIQRFRAASKVDGEAAYCMTNLEAAISFLENVDLASLRADETPEGPKKSEQPSITKSDHAEPFPGLPGTSLHPSSATTTATLTNASGTSTSDNASSSLKAVAELPRPTSGARHHRTLSDLLQPGRVISNANEAVRSTAEEGLKTISSTLDNSLKFFIGKLRERSDNDEEAEVVVPKTLDEARQLVSRPLTPDGDEMLLSETSSIGEKDNESTGPPHLTKTEDKILTLIGGKKQTTTRERSVDSVKSGGSARKIAFSGKGTTGDPLASPKPSPSIQSSNPLDTVKSLGSSINPINHIGSAFGGAFRGFGARPASVPSPPPTTTKEKLREVEEKDAVSLRTPNQDEVAQLKAIPPIARFIETADAGDLKINDVQELLKDYQRLAKLIDKLRVERS